MFKRIIAILFFTASTIAFTQQLPIYSQYMLNDFLINPASAGSDGFTSVNLTAREQWIGFENAPRTQSLSFQTRLLKSNMQIRNRTLGSNLVAGRSGRVGLGGMVFNDKNGLVNRTGIQFSYAYHIFINNHQLSFGLSGSAYHFRVRDEEMDFGDFEPLIYSGLHRGVFVPDASVGVYMMGSNYYLGVSSDQLFQAYLKLGNQSLSNYRMLRQYYLMGGYRFYTVSDYDYEPHMLLKFNERGNVQVDLGLKTFFKDNYWFGGGFRTSGTIIAIAGFTMERLNVGYSFDYTLSNLRKHSYGSHEFMIAFKFGDSARRYRWLERY